MKNGNDELATERNQHLKKNNIKARLVNKVMTEADEQFNTHAIGNMNIYNYNTNNRYTLSTNENDEAGERISILRNIVDKAPKLNLEV